MERIEISTIRPGLRFSKPVFFDDEKYMFIEAGIHVKPYHVAALTKWRIPFLLSDGHVLAEGEPVPDEPEFIDSVETLDSLEEVEEVSDLDSEPVELGEASEPSDLAETLEGDADILEFLGDL